MKKLDVYEVIDGQDNWPLVGILEGETDDEVIALAEEKYGSDQYHWTNPY